MIIKLCTLDGLRRRADKTVSLTLRTSIEQTSEEMKDLDLFFQQHLVVAIKPENSLFTESEIDDLSNINVDLYDSAKSQSKRMRAVIWRLHEQELKRSPTKEEFSVFYNLKTEQIIEHFKNKLD